MIAYLVREWRLRRAHREYVKAKRDLQREAQRRLAIDVEARAARWETQDFVKRHNAALKDTGRKVI